MNSVQANESPRGAEAQPRPRSLFSLRTCLLLGPVKTTLTSPATSVREVKGGLAHTLYILCGYESGSSFFNACASSADKQGRKLHQRTLHVTNICGAAMQHHDAAAGAAEDRAFGKCPA